MWKITTQKGSVIKLQLTKFASHEGWIRIYDGETCTDNILYFMADAEYSVQDLGATGNKLLVVVYRRSVDSELLLEVTYTSEDPTITRTTVTTTISTKTLTAAKLPTDTEDKDVSLKIGTVIPLKGTSSENCNQNLFSETGGIFVSPGYPEGRRRGFVCNIGFSTLEDKLMQFTLTDVQFESDETGVHDFLLLFDGKDCWADNVINVNPQTTKSVTATSKYLTAFYVKGHHSKAKGFLANYAPVDDQPSTSWQQNDPFLWRQSLNGNAGNIKYPESDGEQFNLVMWKLIVNAGLLINLRVDTFKSKNGWIRVYDGETCAAKILLYKPDEISERGYVESSGNTMIIAVYSPDPNSRAEFEATYTALTQPTPIVIPPINEPKLKPTAEESLPKTGERGRGPGETSNELTKTNEQIRAETDNEIQPIVPITHEAVPVSPKVEEERRGVLTVNTSTLLQYVETLPPQAPIVISPSTSGSTLALSFPAAVFSTLWIQLFVCWLLA